jgi:hypothetical protein
MEHGMNLRSSINKFGPILALNQIGTSRIRFLYKSDKFAPTVAICTAIVFASLKIRNQMAKKSLSPYGKRQGKDRYAASFIGKHDSLHIYFVLHLSVNGDNLLQDYSERQIGIYSKSRAIHGEYGFAKSKL